jgi:hypothetical protein
LRGDTGNAGESVVVEGVAHRITGADLLDEVLDRYRGKYGSGFPDPDGNPVFRVEPGVVFPAIP